MLFPAMINAQSSENKVKQGDFQILSGKEWTGTVTIQNEGSKTPKVLPGTLKVENPEENIFLFKSTYTNGSGVSGTDTLRLEKNGTKIGSENVLRRSEKGDTLIIVTEKKLVLDSTTTLHTRYTYKIHPNYFLITTIEKQNESGV